MTTIGEVITELNLIIDHCVANNSRQGYFAALYKSTTEAVQHGIINNLFEDATRMEKLDVVFAKRYIDAWHSYQQNQPCSQSWQLAFDACQQNDLVVLQHLLLGMNTHINLDLAIAAVETAPGQNIFALQNDFATINQILAQQTGTVQARLTKVWWPMKYISQIADGKEKAVINFSITAARKASWANAVALASLPENATTDYIQQLDHTVLQIGQSIIRPQWYKRLVLKLVMWFEEKDIVKNIGFIR